MGDLEEIFSKYGRIESCVIVTDKSQQSRGFGFISFSSVSDAQEAREQMNGKRIDNREVRVDYSITKRAHTPTPGQYMGRESQRSYPSRRYGRDRSRSRDRYSRRDSRRDRSRDRRDRSRDRGYSRRDRSRSRDRYSRR